MNKAVRLNQDTGLLKIIAIATMLIDHIGAALMPDQAWMRIVGRVAFPIFAYCIAAGAVYTRSMGKYIQRLLIIGLISQPAYVLAMNHAVDIWGQSMTPQALLGWYLNSFRYSNIMFELALGLVLIWTLREKVYAVTAVVVALTWALSPYLTTSYGWRGVALMVMFFVLIDQPLQSFFWVAGFMAWWGFYPSGGSILSPYMTVQAWALCALPLIYLPLTSRFKVNKWVFYLFYPGHLAAIYLISHLAA